MRGNKRTVADNTRHEKKKKNENIDTAALIGISLVARRRMPLLLQNPFLKPGMEEIKIFQWVL